MTENERIKARNKREERNRKKRLFWYYSGYIDALESNNINSATFRAEAEKYGLENRKEGVV